MSDPNNPYSGGDVPPPPPPPPGGGAIVPPADPYAQPAPPQDPYAQQPPAAYPPQDPYAQQPPAAYPPQDPYAQQQPAAYPPADPYAQQPQDPYAQQPPAAYPPQDPYAQQQPPAAYPPADPYAQPYAGGGVPPMPPPPGAPTAYQPYVPGGMPGGNGQADIGTGLSWAVKKFQQYLVPFLSLSALILVVNLIIAFVSNALIDNAADVQVDEFGRITNASNFWSGIAGGIIISIVGALLIAFLRVGLLRAALRTSSGETPSFNDLLTGKNLGAYIITAIVVGIATGVGLVLCVLPGLLAAFFLLFAPVHSLDKGAGVGDAFSWSFNAVKRNVVPCIVLVLIGIVAGIITAIMGGLTGGIAAAVIGLFLEPFSALLNANLYRQMGAEPIAP